MYAPFVAVTTVATNWVILALSTALGGLGAGDCDRSVDVDGIVVELPVACAPDNIFALLGATTAVVVLSGAVFGDHASPISDTTVVASMAAATDHIDHVRTQLPYALLAGAVALVLYLGAGTLL